MKNSTREICATYLIRVIDAVVIFECLPRIRCMALPSVININDDPDYGYVLLPDITEAQWPYQQPNPTETEHKNTLAMPKNHLSMDDSSGIGFDTQNGCILGASISNVMGLRLLRRYFHPDAVRERENDRKNHPENYWQDLNLIDRERLIGWSRCGFCWQATWCVIYHPDGMAPRHEDEIICQECFEEGVIQ